MSKLLTFAKYNTVEEAEADSTILSENGVHNTVEVEKTPLDSNFVGKYYNDGVLLKLSGTDFKKAQQLIFEKTIINLDELDKEYSLLSFSKDELLDVVKHPDDWGIYNVKLASMLLNEMGISMSVHSIFKYQEADIEEHAKPKDFNRSVILLCNFFSLFAIVAGLYSEAALFLIYAFWFLPGLLGCIIGLTIYRSKKTLSDGTQVYSYSPASRKQGIYMIALSLFAIAFNIGIFVYRSWAIPVEPMQRF